MAQDYTFRSTDTGRFITGAPLLDTYRDTADGIIKDTRGSNPAPTGGNPPTTTASYDSVIQANVYLEENYSVAIQENTFLEGIVGDNLAVQSITFPNSATATEGNFDVWILQGDIDNSVQFFTVTYVNTVTGITLIRQRSFFNVFTPNERPVRDSGFVVINYVVNTGNLTYFHNDDLIIQFSDPDGDAMWAKNISVDAGTLTLISGTANTTTQRYEFVGPPGGGVAQLTATITDGQVDALDPQVFTITTSE